MSKVLIIADDLTGANANCALMKKIGVRAASFLGTSANQLPKDIDVVACSSDSRAMSDKQAYREVKARLETFKNNEFSLYSKRIDSTLRGNLGPELNAFHDYFKEANNSKKTAICVPAFPDSGRIVVDGTLYVNGSLLMNTDAGRDPKMPVISNKVVENFQKEYDGKVKHININEVDKGADSLSEYIKKYSDTYDLLVFDAISNEHILEISKAVLKSDIDFFAVDPGPFTRDLTSLIYKESSISTKALALIGSVTKITIDQMKNLKKNYNYYQVNVDPKKLLSMETIEDELKRCLEECNKNIDNVELLIVTTTPDKLEDRLDLISISKNIGLSIDDISLIISRGLANIAKDFLEDNKSISGVFSSGGDITVALAEELLSLGIEVKEEVIPLAAYGRLIGGKHPGLKIVSKGGMVGGPNAMINCIEKILKLED